MPRTIDRYILREILGPFTIALVVFTFLLQIAPLSEVAEKLISKGVAGRTVAMAMVDLLPQALGITVVVAFLLGLLVAFGRLSDDREWVALQACGVSIYRLLRPIFAIGLVAAGTTAFILMWAVPNGNQAYREIAFRELSARAEGEVKPRVFFDYFPNMVLYARDVLPSTPGWVDVFVADTGQGGQPIVYLARHGRLVFDRARRTVELVLEDGVRHVVAAPKPGQTTETYEVGRFERLVLNLNPDVVFPRAGPEKGVREMTIPELQALVADNITHGISPHNPVMEIQRKFSIPFACLVFAVMGLALGVSSSRSGKLSSFVVGLAVIFGYYVVMYTTEAMAKGQLVPAWLAPWTPNVLFGAIAVLLLVGRGRSSERLLQLPLPSFMTKRSATGPAAGSPARKPIGSRVVLVVRIPHGWAVMPGILDVYIARRFVGILALTAVSLLGIFYISTFIDISDKIFKGTATMGTVLEYFWYQTPMFVYYVIPLSLLIGGLVTIGALTKSSELVVMKACGISLYRVALPLLLISVLGSGVLFLLGEQVLPDANRRAQALLHVIRGGSPQTFDLLNRRWVVGRQGEIFNYSYFDPRRHVLTDLSVYEFHLSSWTLARRTFASQAVYDRAAAVSPDQPPVWHATRGWVRDFTALGESRSWNPFASRDLALEPPAYFGTEQPEAERMTYAQLKRHIGELEAGGFNVVPLAVQLHRKLSFPFVAVVMMLIAVPFAVTTGRQGALYGIGVGIALAITYWVMGNIFAAVGSGGALAPALAAWAPNLLFGAAAAYLLLTVRT